MATTIIILLNRIGVPLAEQGNAKQAPREDQVRLQSKQPILMRNRLEGHYFSPTAVCTQHGALCV